MRCPDKPVSDKRGVTMSMNIPHIYVYVLFCSFTVEVTETELIAHLFTLGEVAQVRTEGEYLQYTYADPCVHTYV